MMTNMEDSQQTPVPTMEPIREPPIITASNKKPLPLISLLGGVIALLLLAILMLFLQNQRAKNVPEEIVATPTAAPTPTPIRKPSALSSTQAFATFSSKKASFSAEINNYSFQEGLFTPPTLDLDLGIND